MCKTWENIRKRVAAVLVKDDAAGRDDSDGIGVSNFSHEYDSHQQSGRNDGLIFQHNN